VNGYAAQTPPDNQSNEADIANLERYRRELTGHCCRMLGSTFEAHDAVQETIVRAWQSAGAFEGRSTVRTWLYRIATNVCIDMLRRRHRQARPIDIRQCAAVDASGARVPEHTLPHLGFDEDVMRSYGDPAELTVSKEAVRLAFVTAVRHLPDRQRAVVFLRDVLRWRASEVAGWLETSVASVNSAHQRARAKLAALEVDASRAPSVPHEQDALVERYVAAFERSDIDTLVALLTPR